MAASKCATTPKVLDLSKCYLCSKPFSDPKLLPCLHSFCAGCLAKRSVCQKGLGQSTAVCPTCSATFTVPGRGFCSLPTNNLAKRLVELQKVTSQTGATCGACLENEENKPATVYCHDCQQHLCTACSNIHKRLKATSSHTVLTIGVKALNTEDLVKNHVEMCPQHPQERASLYCSNCWKLICTVCFVAEHKQHSCHDALSQAAGFRNELKESVEHLSARGEWYKSEKAELKAETQKFLTSVFEAQKGVRDKAEEAKRTIDEQQNELLKKLDQLKEEKLAEIGRSESWFGTSMTSVEHCLQFVLDVLSKGSEGDVLGLYGDMYRRLDWLLKDKPMTVTQDSVAFQASSASVGNQQQVNYARAARQANFGQPAHFGQPANLAQQVYLGGMQQQFFPARERSRCGAVRDVASIQNSRSLINNPLGEVIVTSTASNRRN